MIAEIRPAEPIDAIEVIVNANAYSREEVEQVGVGAAPIVEMMEKSEYNLVGTIDGRIAILWGVFPVSLLGNTAYMWAIVTKEADDHPFVFARKSQMVLKDLLTQYSGIYGAVRPSHERSIRWLKWLGFEVDPPRNGVCRFHRGIS